MPPPWASETARPAAWPHSLSQSTPSGTVEEGITLEFHAFDVLTHRYMYTCACTSIPVQAAEAGKIYMYMYMYIVYNL